MLNLPRQHVSHLPPSCIAYLCHLSVSARRLLAEWIVVILLLCFFLWFPVHTKQISHLGGKTLISPQSLAICAGWRRGFLLSLKNCVMYYVYGFATFINLYIISPRALCGCLLAVLFNFSAELKTVCGTGYSVVPLREGTVEEGRNKHSTRITPIWE